MTTPTLSNNFLEETADALGDAKFKDVTITLDDKSSFRLHKLILAANSSFFRKLFYHQPKMAYEVGGVSKKSFEAMMGYMYFNTLTITPKNFDDILSAAQFLGCAFAEKLEKMTFLVKIGRLAQINGMETIYCPWIEPNNEMD